MMKAITLLLLFTLTLSISCMNNDCDSTEREVKQLMKSWYKKKILFPQNMIVLMDESINKEKIPNQSQINNHSIVHFFTADCDKCVNELTMIMTSLKNNPKNSSISYIFIASAPTKKYVLDAIKKTKFPYPIYYEKEYYSFKTINSLPISDDVFDTMLLNSKQEVILFGAFYDNDKAKKLYSKAIDCDL